MIYTGKSLSVSLLEDGFAELVFDAQGSVNKFDRQTVSELDEATQALLSKGDIKGLVVRSAKPAFIVGADITEFTGLFAMDDAEVLQWVANTSQVFDRFEDLPFPTIAAVNGFALGGGCEMALACDMRIADTTASIGLPEVKLGLMPGFGGTVRLPRLIGIQQAMKMMLTGSSVRAKQAKKYGIVDDVVPYSVLLEVAEQFALKRKPEREAPQKGLMNKMLENTGPGKSMMFKKAREATFAKTKGNYPAPGYIIDVIETGVNDGIQAGLKAEAEAFGKLVMTPESFQLRQIFFATTEMKKENGVEGVKPEKMNKVGVKTLLTPYKLATIPRIAGAPINVP